MPLNLTDPKLLTPQELESGDIFAPRFDEKGLVTAITIDAHSNEVLMLAHMNAEAVRLTLETGFVHYYSRSRQKIWKKGESSGELQELVEIRVDCDQDALLILAHQTGRGAACHTGRKSCFFRKVSVSGEKLSLQTIDDKPLFDPKDVY